jgi:hypothetical protein
MAHRPEEVVRYTVEQSGGEYVTDVPDLLSLFKRRQLTDKARREMRYALQRQGVGAEPDLLAIQRSDRVRLFLLERQPVSAGAAFVPLARRLWPRTWKGWTVYAVIAVFIVAALNGESEESHDSRPVAERIRPESPQSDSRADNSEDDEALRRERAALREERARVRRARAQARRERVQARRERAEARRERARIRRAQAAARRRRERQQELAAQAAAAESASNCHPSYDPCLNANASDYDCEGGSGDGPEYTGFVTVKGTDDFGLDSDGDGSGCE